MGKKKFDFEFQWDFDDAERKQPSRPLKFLPLRGGVVEITTRTFQGRFLMKPSTRANEIIEGVLGRALSLHPGVALCGYWFLSNHYNLLGFFPDVGEMAAFMDHVNSNLARELGRLYGWKEKFFGRRYRGIVVADGESEVRRMAYLLAQGTKEGLVARPAEWPGASCIRALLTGAVATGKWTDRTALYRARLRDARVREKDFVTVYAVPLHPLPCWKDVSENERRRRIGEIVEQIEHAAKQLNARLKRKPLGAARILAQDPHARPDHIARSPAPLCHASSRRRFWKFANVYRAFVQQYQAASKALREGDLTALDRFPPGCFLPTWRKRPVVRAAA